MKNKKIRIAVLSGGPSAEYAVSLNTGRQVMKNLDKKKYGARRVVISKTGKWALSPVFIKKNFDAVFLAMHGEYGEDGTIQKILEKNKILFTGSGARASRLGMDKIRSGAVFRQAGLNVPRFIKARNIFPFEKGGLRGISFPIVVKPNDRGSSVGTGVARNPKELAVKIKKARKFSGDILIQEYIKGREFTCGVLEIGGRPRAFLPTEIIPKTSGFFDYFAKYTKGASQEITPPPNLLKIKIAELQKIALRAHQAIGCCGFSRTDMILGPDDKFYVLEINTIPGLTETSLFPKAAKASGISFKKLLDLIIRAARK